ncbi:MAG: hypothetical protein L0H93_10550 [Nocardioides sp.]|nr:hypothetical protein [Nocardioides sp.]
MPNYQEAREQQIQAQTRTRIRGTELRDHGFKGWRVFGCVCVTEEGCPCKSVFWWVKDEDILAEGRTDERTEHGDPVTWVEVHRSADLVEERLTSFPASEADAIARGVSKKDLIKGAFAAGMAVGNWLNANTSVQEDVAEPVVDVVLDFLKDLWD